MFNLEEAITRWRQQMNALGFSSDSLAELEAHLRDDIEYSLRSGASLETAFQNAVQRLGSGKALKGEFARAARGRFRHCVPRVLYSGVGAFLLGIALSYFVLLPILVSASRAYAKWLGFSAVRWDSHDYFLFVLKLGLGTGLCFEIPVLLLTLVKTRIIDYSFCCKARKYVIVLNLFLAAVLTSPEVITQLILFVPLQLLYEISVWIARSWERRDKDFTAAL